MKALKKSNNYFTVVLVSVAVLSYGAELFSGIVSGLLSIYTLIFYAPKTYILAKFF
jgi:hypothetical protein